MDLLTRASGSDKSVEEWPELGCDKAVVSWPKPQATLSVEKDSGAKELDTREFPPLSQDRSSAKLKQSTASLPPFTGLIDCKEKTTRKRKVKKSTPLQVDICELIQAATLKKQLSSRILPLRKSVKIKRHILCGNNLDSDQPVRHKGKVRPWKPRDLTKTKKIICASRKIRLHKLTLTRDVLQFKENFGSALKLGKVDVDNLVGTLTALSLNKSGDQGEPNDAAARNLAKTIIHGKKFKSYCTNLVTQDLKAHAKDLIVALRTFQDRMHAKDEIKAHAKRRYVCGFNETRKFLLADRIKLIIVATNLEMEEGLPSMAILKFITDAAQERNVPVVYGGLAENIGYWTLKKAKISILGVMNYEGADQAFAKLMQSRKCGQEEYDKLARKIVELYSSKLAASTSPEVIEKEVEEEIKEVMLKKLRE